MDNLPRVMDYSFTAEMEKDFDEIAEGNNGQNIKTILRPFPQRNRSMNTPIT